jgi:hypothetical protein
MQRLLLPLLNIHFEERQIDICAGLRLRSVSDDERLAWKADPIICRYAESDEIDGTTHVVEQVSSLSDLLPNQLEAGENLFTLIALVEIFMPERLRAPIFIFDRELGNNRTEIFEQRQSLQRNQLQYASHVRLAERDLLGHWSLLVKAADGNRRLRRALGRYAMAREAHFGEDAILQATIGIECLFSPDRDKGNTSVVASGIVMWLSDPASNTDVEALADSFQAFKRAYNFRSLIVHGKVVPENGLNDAAHDLLNALRRSILIALGAGVDNLNPDSLYQQFSALAGATLAKRNITLPNTAG